MSDYVISSIDIGDLILNIVFWAFIVWIIILLIVAFISRGDL